MVLHRLGLSPVVTGDRPASGSDATVASIAERVLRLLGVNPVDEADTPSGSGTTTVAAIALRALQRLAVVAADETPASADTTLAEQKVAAVHETLVANSFVTWASSVVPIAAAEHYTIMTAGLLAPAFGMPFNAAEAEAAASGIRAIALAGAGGQALAEIEVHAAHQVLNAQGFVTWDTAAIPPSVAAHYAVMAATRLAPTYGRTMPEDGYAASMGLIRRIILSGSTGDDLAEDKVVATHEMLAAMGVVTWASSAIPLYATEHYAAMAAHLLAPAIGMSGDPASFQTAQDAMRGIALSGAAGQTLAEAEVTAAHQTLNGLGYVTWAISAVPESVASHYATMAAVRLAPAYGRTASEDAYADAVGLVRRIVMSGSIGQALAEEKVRAAHASLDARGLTRWTLTNIPDYAEEPLIMIAAEMLAPDVGQPALTGMALAGEREIRRVIAMPTAGGAVKAAYY